MYVNNLFSFSLIFYAQGDFISSLGIVKQERRLRLGYDLAILRKLKEPTTVYDLVKIGYRPSSAYNVLKKYSKQGIIRYVKTERVRFGVGYKKYYTLTELGCRLLSLLEKINNNRLNEPKRRK